LDISLIIQNANLEKIFKNCLKLMKEPWLLNQILTEDEIRIEMKKIFFKF